MKKRVLLFLLLVPVLGYSQTNHGIKYNLADSLIQNNKIEDGYLILEKLELEVPQSDTLYIDVLWYQIQALTFLESKYRMTQDFEKSLDYGLKALDKIEKGKDYFDDEFLKREPFMIKNIVVSSFGLKRYELAQKYKDKLYEKYHDNTLPKGIDEYFNFDYFKWEDKNIWGYEWYEELPENRFSKSFSKVVYYVYSTNDDGSDNEQLYRLHLLMFHASESPFDYVMTKYLDAAKDGVIGSLYAYTYKKDIDFEKLHNDVIRELEGKALSDFEEFINKQNSKK